MGKSRVLIVDDELDFNNLLKDSLEHSYDVFQSVDGLQAVEMAKQVLPAVVLIDLNLPSFRWI